MGQPVLASAIGSRHPAVRVRGEKSLGQNGFGAWMPRFHFHLRAGGRIYSDLDGTNCPDIAAARRYAVGVARELMLNSEATTRLWSLCIEAEGGASFDLFFAEIDSNMHELSPDHRAACADVCRSHAALVDALRSARATAVESRMLMSRVTGKPQLVYARKSAQAPG